LVRTKPKSLSDVAAVYGSVLARGWLLGGPPPAEVAELLAVVGPGGPTDVPFTDADRLFDRADKNKITEFQRKIDRPKATSPCPPPGAMVLNDAPTPTQPVVFVRGNPGNRGPTVPRQAPAVVAGANRKPFADGSGRLELAKAVVSPDNP